MNENSYQKDIIFFATFTVIFILVFSILTFNSCAYFPILDRLHFNDKELDLKFEIDLKKEKKEEICNILQE